MLTSKRWSRRLNAYLARLEQLGSTDTIIIGGRVSRDHDKSIPGPRRSAEIVPAALLTEAGPVGAASAGPMDRPPALPYRTRNRSYDPSVSIRKGAGRDLRANDQSRGGGVGIDD
jgi:hypothetical protein